MWKKASYKDENAEKKLRGPEGSPEGGTEKGPEGGGRVQKGGPGFVYTWLDNAIHWINRGLVY